jgi:hypothetical protein
MQCNELSRDPRLSSLYKEMSEALADMVSDTWHGALDMALCDMLVDLQSHKEDTAVLLAAMVHELIFELALLADEMDANALTDKLLGIIAAKTETAKTKTGAKPAPEVTAAAA